MKNWDHKDEWHKPGKDFLVVVKHHTAPVFDVDAVYRDGPQRWNVYAYIYPKHQRFSAFRGPEMFQDAANALPLHGGPSFLRWHRDDDGKPTSVQVGSDYHHLHDDYTNYATPKEAGEVFSDADRLHAFLSKANEVAE